MHSCLAFALIALFTVSSERLYAASEPEMNLERSVCGLKEPFMFWLWSRAAGRPNPERLAGLPHIEDVAVTAKDGRILRGYRLKASPRQPDGALRAAKGYLLVLQGNAMLADQLITEFSAYADAGYDVYVYDYRGYGRSQGKRRLRAMLSDYREIINRLNAGPYAERLAYALSFGGILLLDAWQPEFGFDRVVIDSSPSRLSNHGCPRGYDPVDHLPGDCGRFLFVVGLKDRVVTPAMSRELTDRAEQCGARVVRDPAFAHPFMDPSISVRQRRDAMIEQFLLQR